MTQAQSLQQRHSPKGICFGCGQANPEGFQIRSYPKDGEVHLPFAPSAKHQAFEGVINGGAIGVLFDCHGNWTAAHHLFERDGVEVFPSTVTAHFKVSLLAPTPMTPFLIRSWVERSEGSKVWVEEVLEVEGKVTAKCEGFFVSVKPGHPAYHRW